MAPGFERVPGKFELAVLLTRIMFPFLVLVSLAAQAMGLLNACDRYAIPALASVFFNVGSRGVRIWRIGYTMGRPFGHGLIVSMAFGVVAGGVLQLALAVAQPISRRLCRTGRASICGIPGFARSFALMLPAVLGNAALQINTIVNTNLASSLTDAAGQVINGPVSWLGYAFRFLQLPLGVFGVAIASAALPPISRNAAAGRMEEFRGTLEQSLGMVLLLTIPSSVGLAVLGESMIGTLSTSGAASKPRTRARPLWRSPAIPSGWSDTPPPRFSRRRSTLSGMREPRCWSASHRFSSTSALALGLVHWAGMGHAGLALSTSLVALFGAAAAVRRAQRAHSRLGKPAPGVERGADRGRLRHHGDRVPRCRSLGIHAWMGHGKAAQIADVAVSIPLGACVFYVRRTMVRECQRRRLSRPRVTLLLEEMLPDLSSGDPHSRKLTIRLGELSREIATLPKHIAEIEKKLISHERKLDADRAALSANQKERKKCESDIQIQEQKISKLKDQMLSREDE